MLRHTVLEHTTFTTYTDMRPLPRLGGSPVQMLNCQRNWDTLHEQADGPAIPLDQQTGCILRDVYTVTVLERARGGVYKAPGTWAPNKNTYWGIPSYSDINVYQLLPTQKHAT